MSDKGAHFFRCDLQVHSLRDINWNGHDAITEDERRAYARKLVEACRECGLRGIAITDHHDVLFASYVRKAAYEETDQERQFAPEGCAGDVIKVDEYVDVRGLRNALFHQLPHALIELAPAASDERSLLQSSNNHISARPASADQRQTDTFNTNAHAK
jgi:hypothetical protein